MNENNDSQNPDEVSRSARSDDQTQRPSVSPDSGSAAEGRRDRKSVV